MYDNVTKGQARGWAWNRLTQQIPGRLERKKARIFCLIGDTTNELEAGISKGFSRHNIIGVDVKKEAVIMWRKAGGLAIQIPLEAAIAFSKIRPQGVIADFHCGINDMTFKTFLQAVACTDMPGCIIINMLRGRDQVEDFRLPHQHEFLKIAAPELLQVAKKRNYIILQQLFNIVYTPTLTLDPKTHFLNPREAKRNFDDFQRAFMHHFDVFKQMLNPKMHSYKSQDSGQWFDMLSIDSFRSAEPVIDLDEWRDYDIPLIRRRLAALEACRTNGLKLVGERQRAHFANVA